MNAPKNISASVKSRLQNVAATRGEDFNLLLLRYGIERLLFRLSQSPHADQFLLKGAMLFVVWDEKTHRPTRDLDLLGFDSAEKADLIQVFAAVAAVPVVDDVPPGVVTVTSSRPGVPAGAIAVIWVSESTVYEVAFAVPNFTALAPIRLVPVITTVPPTSAVYGGASAVTEIGRAHV